VPHALAQVRHVPVVARFVTTFLSAVCATCDVVRMLAWRAAWHALARAFVVAAEAVLPHRAVIRAKLARARYRNVVADIRLALRRGRRCGAAGWSIGGVWRRQRRRQRRRARRWRLGRRAGGCCRWRHRGRARVAPTVRRKRRGHGLELVARARGQWRACVASARSYARALVVRAVATALVVLATFLVADAAQCLVAAVRAVLARMGRGGRRRVRRRRRIGPAHCAVRIGALVAPPKVDMPTIGDGSRPDELIVVPTTRALWNAARDFRDCAQAIVASLADGRCRAERMVHTVTAVSCCRVLDGSARQRAADHCSWRGALCRNASAAAIAEPHEVPLKRRVVECPATAGARGQPRAVAYTAMIRRASTIVAIITRMRRWCRRSRGRIRRRH